MSVFDELKSSSKTAITKEEAAAKGFWAVHKWQIIGGLALVLFGFIAGRASAQTLNIPGQKACTTIPAQQICVTTASQTVTLPSSGGSSSQPPPVVPTGVTWMYLNGVKTLAGDFTQGNTSVSYQHATSAGYNSGTKDILFSATAPMGLYLPYWAANYQLPNPGWTYLLLSLKPTVTGDTFSLHAERYGDSALPGIELVTASANKYGPAAVGGQWGTYKVPLADLGIQGDKFLYKVVLGTHTGTPDSWEMDAIGFQ